MAIGGSSPTEYMLLTNLINIRRMTTNRFYLFLLCMSTLLIAFSSCKKEVQVPITDIKIGGDEMLSEVAINRQVERKILLSGGSGKYKVNIHDSRIATASISKDTLMIKGILEGETFATVLSHDKKAKLKISVVAPSLSFSHKEVEICPKDRAFFVSLAGGGEHVQLTKIDPDEALSMRWDARTGIVELHGLYEGEVEVIATAESGERATLHVRIKAADKILWAGVYGTNDKYYNSNELLRCITMVEKAGIGVTLHNSTLPYGGKIDHRYEAAALQFTPEIFDPKVGEMIELDIRNLGSKTKVEDGHYSLRVEEVREESQTVVLHHPRFKVHIPYYKRTR